MALELVPLFRFSFQEQYKVHQAMNFAASTKEIRIFIVLDLQNHNERNMKKTMKRQKQGL